MYCPWCVRQIKDDVHYCSYCGKDVTATNADNALPIGTILSDRYYLGTVLGQGGFGITYVGCDKRLNKKVAIKEYYPVNLVSRISGHSTHITVNAGNQAELFERERRRFIQEAQLLAEFSNDRNVVGVTDIFEENNTAYIIMEYVEGENLKDYIQNHGRMTFEDALKMIDPMMDSLSVMHSKDLIHRDISPANIMVQPDKHAILIDFGSAREYGLQDGISLTVTVKHGYAPAEQYQSNGEQGPWTDIYALCATFYWMITGVTPPSAVDRTMGQTMKTPSELGAVISQAEEKALMKGLELLPRERFSSINELEKAFGDAANLLNAFDSESAYGFKTEIIADFQPKTTANPEPKVSSDSEPKPKVSAYDNPAIKNEKSVAPGQIVGTNRNLYDHTELVKHPSAGTYAPNSIRMRWPEAGGNSRPVKVNKDSIKFRWPESDDNSKPLKENISWGIAMALFFVIIFILGIVSAVIQITLY